MEYSKIIAITGVSGLFELAGNKPNGAIVKNIEDNSVKFISSRNHNFSQLESIEVYTTGENVSLSDLFEAMEKKKEIVPSSFEKEGLMEYFNQVYPELDFERVHLSDMKKMVKWFNLLSKAGIDFKMDKKVEEN